MQVAGKVGRRVRVNTYSDWVLGWMGLLAALAAHPTSKADSAAASVRWRTAVEWTGELGHTGFHLLYGWDQWVREQIWAGRMGWDYAGCTRQYTPPKNQVHGTTICKFYYTEDSPGACMQGEACTWKHDRTLAGP